MESFMKEFEHLKIHLEDLKKATNSFGSKAIGVGGFGKVYEGEISHSKGRSLVAIKRLSREFGQGVPEFLNEIMILSRYSHENLITLLGYCDEDGEKILVYEHASNGSLDRHLSSNVLTWPQRLKICLDAAKGLEYLHDHRGTQQRILHRDVKSANILLDDNWNAKLSDMGLSKVGPANQQHSVLITNLVGTPGYCDPQYMETYMLSKESDIYSFGVVLFEVLCGKLCFRYTNDRLEVLVPLWKQSYIDKNLDQIIFKDLRPSMDPTSFETFSEIAFQCLHYSREQRPTASLLVEKLEIALKCQERHDMKPTNVMGNFFQVGDDVTTRNFSYQIEALAQAIKENTIVTGPGKTLIAIMLLRHYAYLLKKPSPCIAVFLVPTVDLVKQQAEYVRKHLDLKVEEYWGEKGVDRWNAADWKKQRDQNQLLVMTPNILRNALRIRFLTLDIIKVLIFDECHHAKNYHPYAIIMKEFYHRELLAGSSQLPRILGMTASPVKAKDLLHIYAPRHAPLPNDSTSPPAATIAATDRRLPPSSSTAIIKENGSVEIVH